MNKVESVVDSDKWDGENPPDVYIDFLGQEVRVGDYVAYATSSGSSTNIAIGQILEFKTHNKDGKPYGDTRYDYNTPWDYTSKTPRPSYFEPRWMMLVQPILDSRYGRGNGRIDTVNKKVQLSILKNVHKVDISHANIEVYDDI